MQNHPAYASSQPTIFINLSNHPSDQWSKEQLEAAKAYGEVVDLPFPAVEPHASEGDIDALAVEYVAKVLDMSKGATPVVHLMGEMNFTYRLVSRLTQQGITCLASTTERIVRQLPDGTRNSTFRFVQFRRYV